MDVRVQPPMTARLRKRAPGSFCVRAVRRALLGWLMVIPIAASAEDSPLPSAGDLPGAQFLVTPASSSALSPDLPASVSSGTVSPASSPTSAPTLSEDLAPETPGPATETFRARRAPVMLNEQHDSQRHVSPTGTLKDGGDPAPLREQLAKRGDITLRETSLSKAMLIISETWDVSVVIGDDVRGNVSGSFKNASLSEVLDALLLSNGYSYRPVGRSIVIMKLAEVGDVNPAFETAAIGCGSGNPKELAEHARILLSPRGKAQAVEGSNSIIVFDYPDRVAAIRKLIGELDNAAVEPASEQNLLQVMDYHAEYVKVELLKEPTASLLSKEGKVTIMPLENRLVVLDTAQRLQLVKQMLQHCDTPRSQVRISALIYDVSLSDAEKLGINWNNNAKARHDANGTPQTQFTVDSVTMAPPVQGNVNGVVTMQNLTKNIDLTAVMQALATCKDSRLLADPCVTVVENEKASISIITEIPYQQLTQTQQGGSIGTTSFKNAGIQLDVIPTIAADDTMYLKVNPIFSRLTGFTPNTSQPIIDKREVAATVRVANLQTLVIGGLRQRKDIGTFNGVIGLKDVKVAGKLFRSRDTQIDETELVVFIRPELITPFDAGKCRQQAARDLTDALLDQVPVAVGPQPGCRGCQPPGRVDPTYPSQPPIRRSLDEESSGEEIPTPQPDGQASAQKDLYQRLAKVENHNQGVHASEPMKPAASASPATSAPANKPGFWEKQFSSDEHPNGTLVERKPLRPDYDQRYHERNMKWSSEPDTKLREQTARQGEPSAEQTKAAKTKDSKSSWWDRMWGKKPAPTDDATVASRPSDSTRR